MLRIIYKLPKETRLAGVEPATYGLENRCRETISPEKTKTYKTTAEQWTPQLTPQTPKQAKIDTSGLPSDLAEIAAAWPELPVAVKAAITAMVKAIETQNKKRS